MRLFVFGNLDILDIASAKDNEAIFLLRRRDEFVDCPIFGPKGKDVFQRDRGLFRVDLMQRADIARETELLGQKSLALVEAGHIPNFTFGYEVEPLADQMIHVHDG